MNYNGAVDEPILYRKGVADIISNSIIEPICDEFHLHQWPTVLCVFFLFTFLLSLFTFQFTFERLFYMSAICYSCKCVWEYVIDCVSVDQLLFSQIRELCKHAILIRLNKHEYFKAHPVVVFHGTLGKITCIRQHTSFRASKENDYAVFFFFSNVSFYVTIVPIDW